MGRFFFFFGFLTLKRMFILERVHANVSRQIITRKGRSVGIAVKIAVFFHVLHRRDIRLRKGNISVECSLYVPKV